VARVPGQGGRVRGGSGGLSDAFLVYLYG
jgi:hypothetical protein